MIKVEETTKPKTVAYSTHLETPRTLCRCSMIGQCVPEQRGEEADGRAHQHEEPRPHLPLSLIRPAPSLSAPPSLFPPPSLFQGPHKGPEASLALIQKACISGWRGGGATSTAGGGTNFSWREMGSGLEQGASWELWEAKT